MNYSWITKIKFLFTKISSQNAWLVNEEVVCLALTIHKDSFTKIYFQDMNHENFKPRKFGAIWYELPAILAR